MNGMTKRLEGKLLKNNEVGNVTAGGVCVGWGRHVRFPCVASA